MNISEKLNKLVNPNTKMNLVIRNFSWIFTGKIFFAVSNLVVSIITTRYLGPVENGVFNYVVAFTTLFSAIAGMGLESVAVKEFNMMENESGKVFVSGFLLKFLGGLAACLLAIGATLLLGISGDRRVYIGIISVSFVFQAFDIIQYWFQSQSLNKNVVICQNIVRIIFILAKIVLIKYNCTVLAFVIVTSAETCILSLSLVAVYISSPNKVTSFMYDNSITKKVFRLSWPLVISSIAINVYMKIDQLMIGEMLGDYELGIYSAAVRLAESWYFIPVGISAAVLPVLAQTYKQSESRMYHYIAVYADFMVVIAYVMGIVITLFGKQITILLYGTEYVDAAPLLKWYVWAGVFVNLGLVRSSYVSIKECTFINMAGALLGAFSNVILNYILIGKVGMLGAVWATLLSEMIASTMATYCFRRSRRFAKIQVKALFPFKRVVKNTLAYFDLRKSR